MVEKRKRRGVKKRKARRKAAKKTRKGGRRTMVSVDETFPQGRIADELRVEKEKEVYEGKRQRRGEALDKNKKKETRKSKILWEEKKIKKKRKRYRTRKKEKKIEEGAMERSATHGDGILHRKVSRTAERPQTRKGWKNKETRE